MGVISPEVKSAIILALQDPGHVVSKIAKLYGVSEWTIYHLRKKHVLGCSSGPHASDGFVEVRVEDEPISLKEVSPSSPFPFLKRATFVFQEFSLTLEGKVKGGDLQALLKVLEGGC